jgi:hypothetical protein
MAEILTEHITTKKLNGTGVFDELMSTMDVRLLEEYGKGRIHGADYSKVYLGSMTAITQQSIAFLLGRQNADKQAELIAAQILGILADIKKTEAEILFLESQKEKIDAEIRLIEQQIKISEQQAKNIVYEGEKLQAETRLIDQNATNAKATHTLILNQQAKVAMETQVLEQKKFSEMAQRLEIVDGEPVVGIIGAQTGLYRKQTESFQRDAEQKTAKLYVDAFNVRMSVMENQLAGEAGLGNNHVYKVLDTVTGGIGIDQDPPTQPPVEDPA